MAAIAEVVKLETKKVERYGEYYHATVKVLKNLKGEYEFTYVTAFKRVGSCGIGLEIGTTFRFQMKKPEEVNHYGLTNYVGLCTGSRSVMP